MKREKKTNDTVDQLGRLVRLDMDAIMAYDRAISRMSVEHIREKIISFRKDHERHVLEISSVIYSLGGRPPKFKRGFKSLILEGFTIVRGLSGTAGALKAMKGNELLTNAMYSSMAKLNLTGPAQEVIQRGLEDEKRHLAYISRAIEGKYWEKKTTPQNEVVREKEQGPVDKKIAS